MEGALISMAAPQTVLLSHSLTMANSLVSKKKTRVCRTAESIFGKCGLFIASFNAAETIHPKAKKRRCLRENTFF